jgi:flagellar export protein FliJ
MAKFKFRLATLLRLREAARDERRAELAQAYRADEIIAKEQQRLKRDLKQLETRGRRASAPGRLDVDQLLEVRRYGLLLRSQQQEAGRQRQAVEAEIERRREALVEANREVRVLEELRRKQQERHRLEQNRQEIKNLDETASRQTAKEDGE